MGLHRNIFRIEPLGATEELDPWSAFSGNRCRRNNVGRHHRPHHARRRHELDHRPLQRLRVGFRRPVGHRQRRVRPAGELRGRERPHV
ncbi:MAG: hypothetical protein ACK55I_31400, partial [bacterium]